MRGAHKCIHLKFLEPSDAAVDSEIPLQHKQKMFSNVNKGDSWSKTFSKIKNKQKSFWNENFETKVSFTKSHWAKLLDKKHKHTSNGGGKNNVMVCV